MNKCMANFLKCNFSKKWSLCGKETRNYPHNKIFKSSVFNLLEASKDQIQKFLKSFDTVVTDCDGVLWMGDKAIPGSLEVMSYFQRLKKRIIFLTNNSTKTRNELVKKARHLGYKVSKEQIVSGAYLVAQYLKDIGFTKKAYVMGASGIAGELNEVGIRHIGVGPDHIRPDFKKMKMSDLDPEVGAVIIGHDKHISYPKLMKAASYLSSEDCLLLAIGTEEKYSKDGDVVLPGVGIFIPGIETLTKKKAITIGKPHDTVRKYLESCGLNPARTLMIGDTCSTDIEIGVRCGFQTLLVLSGVTSERDVKNIRKNRTPPLPDIVLPKLGDLLSLVRSL